MTPITRGGQLAILRAALRSGYRNVYGLRYRFERRWASVHTKHIARVIFVHINKTGGSSIERALGLPFQHRTAREIRAQIGERRWSQRFSFAFVRNPWDRVASHFHYRVQTKQAGLAERPISFADWVELAYYQHDPVYYDQPKMFMPQFDWVTDDEGRIIVDYIGRFERLTEDFARVCARIGHTAELPHLKRSGRGDYRTLYSAETAEIVARCFEKDIRAFGYTFDSTSGE